MTVRIDAAGNLIGRYPGRNAQLGALATGSHLDTVPVAGRYDGALGILAGIEVVQTLHEQHVQLQHPLEVIVFTDEETTLLGSKAMAGELISDPDAYQRNDSTDIQTCLATIGGNWAEIGTAQRTAEELVAFVELHVEQGGVLEQAQRQIGVVQGVVGQQRFRVKITGCPNHAGTTPMHLRQDALVAAAQVVLAVQRLATETPGEQVATVGSLTVAPNAVNIVPSDVVLTIDLRDLSQVHLQGLIVALEGELGAIAAQTQTQIEWAETLQIAPTLSTPLIMEAITAACDALGYSHLQLPSRAGHDTQVIGRFTQMGMIFVPSRGGISHAAAEYTSPEQCAQGANVLLQTLWRLDGLV